MARRGEGPWTRWLIEQQVVTGVIEGVEAYATPRKTPTLVANTDNLKDYEAYRALDPATAHMRIANWVGGVLPSAPETVAISNASRIRKAGFDLRTSFRKPPEPGISPARRGRDPAADRS
jgi:hypothetical protein